MGNQIDNCCGNCLGAESNHFSLQTIFKEVQGGSNKYLRCRKFYLSSEPLEKQKINELLIFTDPTLTMTLPNYNLKLHEDDVEKLQQALKYEIYNNNLVIKENCFVLNAIQQEGDSQFDEFREFKQDQQLQFKDFNDNNQKHKEIQAEKITSNTNPIYPKQNERQKFKNQIQQFALRNKSRAFRFKNPLRKYQIGQIIVAIVPIYQKLQDLSILKEAIQQGLSMAEDMKNLGVSQISFMLGYETSVFQKMILQYLLGYSKSKREYVFKRINQFAYLTRSKDDLKSFQEFFNIYTSKEDKKPSKLDKLKKAQSAETLTSQKERNLANILRLGNNNVHMKQQKQTLQNPTKVETYEDFRSFQDQEVNYNPDTGQAKKTNSFLADNIYKQSNKTNSNANPINQNKGYGLANNKLRNSNVSNTSYRSYADMSNLVGFDRQKIGLAPQENFSFSRRSFGNGNDPLNIQEISEIRSSNGNDHSELNNIRLQTFKSKGSNVSDYF